MAEKRRGLGRGLGALIATGPTEPIEEAKPQDVSSEKTSGNKPASEKPASQKPVGEKPSNDKSAVEKSSTVEVAEESTQIATSASRETANKVSEVQKAEGRNEASIDSAALNQPKMDDKADSSNGTEASPMAPSSETKEASKGSDDEKLNENEDTTSVADAVDVLRKRSSERRRKALEESANGSNKDLSAEDSQGEEEEVPRMRPVDMFFGGSTGRSGSVSRETSRGNRKRSQVPDLLTARAARVLKNRDEDTDLPVEEENSPQNESATTVAPQSDDVSRETSSASEATNESSTSQVDDLQQVPGLAYAELPIESIHPNRKQPRHVFDEDDMAELEHSIREVGLLQPIVVRSSSEPGDVKYELVMGERRWRAAQRVGLSTIPAIIRETKDEDLLRDALLENLHRSELNPLEEAAAYQQLLTEFDCSQDELSQKIGRSRSQISNTIRLMKLPPLVQRRVAAGVISQGHARALLSLEDVADMERLAQRIVNEGLSVRSVEEIVALQAGLRRAENKKQQKEVARPERLDYFATALSDRLDTQVKITLGAKKGRVSIEFASVDDLNRIMGVIAPNN